MSVIGISLRRILRHTYSQYSSFASNISLQNLYPNSNPKPVTPELTHSNRFNGFIPIEKLEITYSRSSGAGGQNVNMVNTKVDVRFHVASAEWLEESIKQRIFNEHKTKVTKEGFFVIRSEKTRSQQLNLADALEKLRVCMWELSEPEKTVSPETEEKLRHLREKTARIRLSEKRKRSLIKQQRLPPDVEL